MRPVLVFGLGLAGCGRMGLESYAPGDKADTAALHEGPLGVSDIAPTAAPLEGGTTVSVTGWGFAADTRFWFGGGEVGVSLIDDEHLVVSTPEVFSEATVDITIQADGHELVLPGAFTFSASAPADDGGGGGDTGGSDGGGSSAEGLTSGLVQLDYLAIGCPSCFGAADSYQVSASAAFHDPVDGSWFDWMPALGGCVVDPARSAPTSSTLDVGAHVYLEQGAGSIDLRRAGSGSSTTYAASGLGSADYIRSGAYDLTLPDGGAGGPFSVSDAVVATSGFTDFQPIELLYDGASAFPRWSASSMSMTWEPAYVAEAVVVDIVVYNSAGSTELGEVLCLAEDSGGLTLPSSAWSGFPNGSLLAVYFYRWQTTRSLSPIDRSTIEGVATFGFLGTAELRR